MTDLAIAHLTFDQAVDLTERIRSAAETTWALLMEAHEGRAWNVLGYNTWDDYVAGEFGMSRSYAYRLIDQAKVVRALEEATGMSPMGDISERDARAIKPILPEVLDELRECADEMSREEVVKVLRKVVADVKERQAEELAEKRARFADWAEQNQKPFVPTVRCAACDGRGRVPKEGT